MFPGRTAPRTHRPVRLPRRSRLLAGALGLLLAVPLLVARDGVRVSTQDVRRFVGYGLLLPADFPRGVKFADKPPYGGPTPALLPVPASTAPNCHRDQSVLDDFRRRAERDQGFPGAAARYSTGDYGGIAMHVARLPEDGFRRLARALTESPRSCDGVTIPDDVDEHGGGRQYAITVHERFRKLPAVGHGVVLELERYLEPGAPADWAGDAACVYLVRDGDYAALITSRTRGGGPEEDNYARLSARTLNRAVERLHGLHSSGPVTRPGRPPVVRAEGSG
ncbi:hypothetical protein ACFYVL_11280 [Streptomyces sp. NPDC004111]|uniref:hypothetical protein n=1 Tax=Streptomyces sp. NPDC004111 TaxID=3364690 RepID=UPI0036C8079A